MKPTLSLLVLFALVLGGGYFYSVHQTQNVAMTAAPPAPVSSTTSYTIVQVAAHATSASCWAAINGSVYDLTSWTSQHPGGEARILSICGKDGSSLFDGQHGQDPRAQAQLAMFKIGSLAQ